MDKAKQKRLAEAGWKTGSTQDFLKLSDDEAAYVDMKIALAHALSSRRKKLHCTQAELAKRLKSSQSRIAKMESADDSVSLDLLVRSLLKVGASQKEVAKVMAR